MGAEGSGTSAPFGDVVRSLFRCIYRQWHYAILRYISSIYKTISSIIFPK